MTTDFFCWQIVCMCLCPQSCLTLCDPMDYSLPGSSVHGISQARRLEWVAISSSRGSSWPRDWNHVSCVSCTGRRILYQLSHGGSPLSRLNNVKPSLEQGLPGLGKAGAHRAACNHRAQEKTEHQLALMLPRDIDSAHFHSLVDHQRQLPIWAHKSGPKPQASLKDSCFCLW